VFILAANALFTPALLQRSANDRFPDGLANRSGLLGRHLMVHVSDLFALRFKKKPTNLEGKMHHGVSINDFCVKDGVRLGTVHAHSYATAVAPTFGAHTQATSTAFVTILEDLPYVENRVVARSGSDEDITYEYRYSDELRQRNRLFLQSIKTSVSGGFDMQLLQPMGNLNMTHFCGTCRFGTDPSTSVLDRDNRAHDLDNLYVVDASFLPSSGGVGPSLTIAANSLRVSDTINQRL
jgi:choline dehydrogenase-like flavoprotein